MIIFAYLKQKENLISIILMLDKKESVINGMIFIGKVAIKKFNNAFF